MRELVSECMINTVRVLYSVSVEAWGNFDKMGRLQRQEVDKYFIWNIIEITRNIFFRLEERPIEWWTGDHLSDVSY